jgi:hypothetical protein
MFYIVLANVLCRLLYRWIMSNPSHPSHRWPKVGTVGTFPAGNETLQLHSSPSDDFILVGVFGVSRVVGAVENSVKHSDQTAWDSMRYEKRAKWADTWTQMYIQDISRYIKIYQDIIEVWNSIDFNCDNSTCDSVHDTQSLWPGTSSDPFAVQFLDVIVTSDEKRNDGTSSSWVQHCRSSTTLCIEKRC